MNPPRRHSEPNDPRSTSIAGSAAAAKLIFSCEHARNVIPARYGEVARRAGTALETHRGYDPGALALARRLARRLRAPLFTGRCSRLLVELNRSLHHRALWSEFSQSLTRAEKRHVLETYYFPYRQAVEDSIQFSLSQGQRVIHVSVHSFTPILQGVTRQADVGLLYDPRRSREARLCRQWREALREESPALRVRMNYPYRGAADGMVTHLRKLFDPRDYVGVELEVNQALALGDAAPWNEFMATLVRTLRSALF